MLKCYNDYIDGHCLQDGTTDYIVWWCYLKGFLHKNDYDEHLHINNANGYDWSWRKCLKSDFDDYHLDKAACNNRTFTK